MRVGIIIVSLFFSFPSYLQSLVYGIVEGLSQSELLLFMVMLMFEKTYGVGIAQPGSYAGNHDSCFNG
ncbi:hypothetical protein SDC9_182211 [bioreactor metagenome]|uniref:Uncharacterized protein n=1 Tax=bioreactor metagenome TaxID=1076179 RepID=A0A645H6R2_9ZZZZ